jgi:hypothetical protein
MTAIDFPNSPTLNQEFTVGSRTWKWTGSVWQTVTTQVVGETGPEGPEGPQGPEGPEGPQGPAGADGADSTVPGPEGPQGPAGADGEDGATGPEGPQGPAGADGEDGATGPEGPQGPAGADSTVPGPQGEPGADGADGATGPSGVISVTAPITNSGTSTSAEIGIDLSDYYTSAQVDSAIASVVDSAPSTLNTLNELAAALNDDENFASTVTTALGEKAPINNPVFTGTITGTPAAGINDGGADGIGYKSIPKVYESGDYTGPYTVQATDAGKFITSEASRTVTIPSFQNLSFDIGTAITFIPLYPMTIQVESPGVLRLAGTGAIGSRTLAAWGMATAVQQGLDVWVISGNGLS